MIPAPPTDNENERIQKLREYKILDTLAEQAYDDITYLASQICGTAIALVSLVDSERQWFKSRVGLDAQETHRDLAFCAHAIHQPEKLLVVTDAAADERFRENPLVTGDPRIRFYAGAPLRTQEGFALGTLCVIDREPRDLDEGQQRALRALSRQVMAQLELRLTVRQLEKKTADLERYGDKLECYQRKLEERNTRLQAQSRRDGLTGLANRTAFDERLDEEFHRAKRQGNSLALLFLDLDHFKSYNDNFGHPAGDELLRKVAGLLKDHSRTCDIVARYGGEEFAAILPNTEQEGATILGERFRRHVEMIGGTERPVTVSIGLAVADDSIQTYEQLLEHADQALYEAKRAGRNRVVEAVG